MPWVTIANVKGPKGDKGDPGLGSVESLRTRPLSDLPALNINQWIGLLNVGMYPVISDVVAKTIVNRPSGSDVRSLAVVKPLASGVSVVTWQELDGQFRTFEKVISSISANNTPWKRLDRSTRRVLHQLSQPGNGNLRDDAASRHSRIPVRLPCSVDRWDLVLKNFNEQTKINYGDLNFVEVFIGKAVKGSAGQLTPNFDGPPTSLGVPQAQGSGASRRYVLSGINFTLEAGVEYLLSYGYSNPNAEPAHMGIGGAWLGTNPDYVGRYDPPVSNAWSANTPLDVYLTLHAPTEMTVNAYIDSSTGTGQGASYPLRDSYGWKHAESTGALPVLLGHSGSTLSVWADSSRYVWQKLASSFDRVDNTYNGLGSNDDYGGRTLAQNKADATAIAQLVRTHLSDSLVYLTTFPRRSESATIRTSRRARNEYFAGLPDKASACIDRSEAVSGPDGLMRPELDSGDGTHLNTLGQGFLSAAVIRAAQYVPNLNRYTLSEAAGRTVTVWDYLNQREQLVYGDTGWRDVSSWVTPGRGYTVSLMQVRRVGGTVHIRFADATGGTGTFFTPTAGFRVGSNTNSFWDAVVSNEGVVKQLRGNNYGFIVDRVSTNDVFNCYTTYETSDPWPTTLPGVAA
ncbi:hypothetical protein SLW73_02665 [Glutamicibacter protophormiae]|uniref:hypothetical protein n=1 Tax=Glutamicibacter protophormiae TaxID=37930 RepID=UPI002A827F93|nr:hypothetical protein [Glutamicibacter protophormiae]WPR65260.1 hypothetical protein SLW72_02665 [Glutamicibacter protophormiae]WPR68757.1 hypothetical protein SLW73_02665 [Glutamicibacter protophormiae]